MVIPNVNIWIWNIACLNLLSFGWLVSIFYDFKTNICTRDISAQVKISLGYLIIFRDCYSLPWISFLVSLDSFLTRVRILAGASSDTSVVFFQKSQKKLERWTPKPRSISNVTKASLRFGPEEKYSRIIWHKLTKFDWAKPVMPSRSPGPEWRYLLLHFRYIIYGANTRKTFFFRKWWAECQQGTVHRKQRHMDLFLQWIPLCKTELGKW